MDIDRIFDLRGDAIVKEFGPLAVPYGGRSYVDRPSDGWSVTVDVAALEARPIMLNFYDEGVDGHRRYEGDVFGVKMGCKVQEMLAIHGVPNESCESRWSSLLSVDMRAWCQYDIGLYNVRFDNDSDGVIVLASVFLRNS